MTHRPVTTQQSVATYDPEELRRYMVSQTNERLLAIVTPERGEYIQPALNLAEAELRLRGVPFTVPPAPRKALIKRASRRWRLDEVDAAVLSGLVLLLDCLSGPLFDLLREHFAWLSSAFNWFFKMALGGLMAFLTIAALFWWAEYLLARWRPSDHP